MKAMFAAAAVWRGRVALFSGGVLRALASPPCPCRGLGLVPRPVMVRGTVRYTFDPCPSGCEEDRGVTDRGGHPRPTLSTPGLDT
jgi:hypothetical protein